MTVEFSALYLNTFASAGLSKDQAGAYELLLKRGPLQAGQLSRRLGVSRPHAYKILDELLALGLVTKEEPPGKPAQFVPAHPFVLHELVRRKQEEAQLAKQTIDGVMSALVSEYTTATRIPGIRILSGDEGVAELYADVIREKKDLCLIRSTYDDDRPELMELVTNQIGRQVHNKMKTRLIGPMPSNVTPQELAVRDAARLTTRRVMPREQFSLPAQILIYGNKVGITAYYDPLMTTIIENEAIRITLSSIFEIVWGVAKDPT